MPKLKSSEGGWVKATNSIENQDGHASEWPVLAKKGVMDHSIVKLDLCDLIEISFKSNSLILIFFEVVIN